MQPQRLRRQRDDQFMAALRNQRLHCFHRALNDAAERDLLLAQVDAAGGGARDFEQFIDQ